MLSGIFMRRRSSLAVILVVLILTVIATSLASSHNARQVLDAIGGMYEEVSQLPDFTSLKLRGGMLEMDGAPISAQAYPSAHTCLPKRR